MRTVSTLALCAYMAVGAVAFAGFALDDGNPALGDDPGGWRENSLVRNVRLDGNDWTRVAAFLADPQGEDAARSSIKNNFLDRLLDQAAQDPRVGALFLRLYRDRSLSVMTRDFVLQHFAPYIGTVKATGSSKLDNSGAVMLAELRSAVMDAEGMISGSALIGLESLAGRDVGVSAAETGRLAAHLANDERRDPGIRATALQVAAHLGRSEVLPAARRSLQGDRPLPLRLSAVACVAAMGDKTDRALLSKLGDEDSSADIRRAVRHTVKTPQGNNR